MFTCSMLQEGVHGHRGHGRQLGGGPERHNLRHAQAAHTLSCWENKDIDLEIGGVGFIQTLPEECGLQVGSVLQQCARHQPAVGQARDSGQSGVSIQYCHHNQPITAQYSPARAGAGAGRCWAGAGWGQCRASLGMLHYPGLDTCLWWHAAIPAHSLASLARTVQSLTHM